MKNRILAVLAFLLSNSLAALAQDPFVPASFSSAAPNEIASHVCELPNKQLVFMGMRAHPDSTAFVFLTDEKGNVLKSKFLMAKMDTADYIAYSCFLNPDHTISMVGSMSTRGIIRFARIDTNLNLLRFTPNIVTHIDTVIDYNTNFVQIGASLYGVVNYHLLLAPGDSRTQLVKLGSDGFITLSRELDSGFYGGVYAESGTNPITVSADGRHLLFSSWTSDGYVTKVDTNFYLMDTIKMDPAFFTTYTLDTGSYTFVPSNCIEVSPGNIIVGNQVQILSPDGLTNQWGVLKYNIPAQKILGFGAFPLPSPDDSLARRYEGNTPLVPMAHSGSSVYTLGYTRGDLFKGYVVVARYDTSGKPIWIRYLGNKLRKNWPMSIYVCKDGSLLMNGYSDSATAGYHYNAQDFYVVKLDSTSGYPLSIVNVSEQLRSGIVLYPNPAQHELHIRGAATGSQLLLYSISGQLLIQQTVQSEQQAVSIQHLVSGTYTYQVLSKEGEKLSSGSWVKQ